MVSAEDLAADDFNLDLHNPNRPEDLEHRDPAGLLDEMISTERELLVLLEELRVTMNASE